MFSSSIRTALFTLVATALAVSAAPGLSLKVNAPQGLTAVGVEELKLTATITNTGTETLKLLRDPSSALSGAPTNTFGITNVDGASPAFKGRVYKYLPATAAKSTNPIDFLILAPGESVTVDHDLAETYDFRKSGAGDYDFEADTLFHYVDANGEAVAIYATEAEVASVSLRAGALNKEAARDLEKRASFVGCTTSRQTLINTAAANAQTYSSNGLAYLQATTAARTRYTSWFGAYTSTRRATVLSHFTSLTSNSYSSYTYDCSTCTISAYAYVYPSQYGRIYLCSAFWNAPATGTDSKAGTLVHESSHFNAVAATDDHVYGQSGARALAISSPTQAIDNADSHEYFAENTPAEA